MKSHEFVADSSQRLREIVEKFAGMSPGPEIYKYKTDRNNKPRKPQVPSAELFAFAMDMMGCKKAYLDTLMASCADRAFLSRNDDTLRLAALRKSYILEIHRGFLIIFRARMSIKSDFEELVSRLFRS